MTNEVNYLAFSINRVTFFAWQEEMGKVVPQDFGIGNSVTLASPGKKQELNAVGQSNQRKL